MSPLGRGSIVSAGFVCLLGEAIATYVFTPMLKPVVGDLGWTRTGFTLSGLWVSLVMMAAVPTAGALVDRGWTRAVLAFGAICLGGAMYGFSLMRTLGEFYVLASLMGLGAGCVGGVPTTALVSRWFVDRRGLALGVMGLGHNVGGLVLPPLVTWLLTRDGWRPAFGDLALFLWFGVLPVIVLLVREPPAVATATATAPAATGHLRLRDGLATPTFWLLGVTMFLHVLFFSGVIVHFVAFATDVGFTPATAATAFGTLLGLGIVGRLVFGWAADRFPRRAVMEVALLATVVAALLLQRIAAPGVLAAFVVVEGIGAVGVQTVFALLVADCFGAENVGTFLGATMLFQVPGGVLGAILAAASFDRLGSYAPAFALFAVGNVAAAVAVTFLGTTRVEARARLAHGQ